MVSSSKTTDANALLDLSLPASVRSIRKARIAAAEATAELALDERLVDDIRLCVSEAVTNVVRYAYGAESRKPDGTVEVVVAREGDELAVVVRDAGAGIGSSMCRDSPGGFGLMIIGKLTTRYTIDSAEDKGTEIRMIFALVGRTSSERREQ